MIYYEYKILGDKTFGVYLLEPIMRLYLGDFWKQLTSNFSGLVASFIWCIMLLVCGTIITSIFKKIFKESKKSTETLWKKHA